MGFHTFEPQPTPEQTPVVAPDMHEASTEQSLINQANIDPTQQIDPTQETTETTEQVTSTEATAEETAVGGLRARARAVKKGATNGWASTKNWLIQEVPAEEQPPHPTTVHTQGSIFPRTASKPRVKGTIQNPQAAAHVDSAIARREKVEQTHATREVIKEALKDPEWKDVLTTDNLRELRKDFDKALNATVTKFVNEHPYGTDSKPYREEQSLELAQVMIPLFLSGKESLDELTDDDVVPDHIGDGVYALLTAPAEEFEHFAPAPEVELPDTPDIDPLDEIVEIPADFVPLFDYARLSQLNEQIAKQVFKQVDEMVAESGRKPSREELAKLFKGVKGFALEMYTGASDAPDAVKLAVAKELDRVSKIEDKKRKGRRIDDALKRAGWTAEQIEEAAQVEEETPSAVADTKGSTDAKVIKLPVRKEVAKEPEPAKRENKSDSLEESRTRLEEKYPDYKDHLSDEYLKPLAQWVQKEHRDRAHEEKGKTGQKKLDDPVWEKIKKDVLDEAIQGYFMDNEDNSLAHEVPQEILRYIEKKLPTLREK